MRIEPTIITNTLTNSTLKKFNNKNQKVWTILIFKKSRRRGGAGEIEIGDCLQSPIGKNDNQKNGLNRDFHSQKMD